MLLNYAIIWRVTGISPSAVGAVIWRAVAACLMMSGAVLTLFDYWPRTDATFPLFLELCCACVVGALVYVVALLVLWRVFGMPSGAEKHALQIASGLAARMRWWRAADR